MNRNHFEAHEMHAKRCYAIDHCAEEFAKNIGEMNTATRKCGELSQRMVHTQVANEERFREIIDIMAHLGAAKLLRTTVNILLINSSISSPPCVVFSAHFPQWTDRHWQWDSLIYVPIHSCRYKLNTEQWKIWFICVCRIFRYYTWIVVPRTCELWARYMISSGFLIIFAFAIMKCSGHHSSSAIRGKYYWCSTSSAAMHFRMVLPNKN